MSRRAVLALLGLGGGLSLLAAAQPWVTLTLEGDLGSATVEVAGSALAPVAAAAGVVAVAGTLAALVARTWGRRVVGALVLVATLVALVQVVPIALALEQRARDWWAVEVGAAAADADAVVAPWWPWLAVAGLVLAGTAAAAVLALGSSWSGLAGRYESSAPSGSSDPWVALDRGDDPTQDTAVPPAGP